MQGLLKPCLVSGQVSTSMVAELHELLVNRITNIAMILDEVARLEGAPRTKPSRTKPAALFTRKRLKGLWHKHHLHSSMFAMQRNLENHWKRNPKVYVLPANLTPDQLWLAAGKVSHEIVLKGYQDRSDAGELTGEWIVYARQDGINYYLTLGSHNEDDDAIWQRCRACSADFPKLLILKEAR